MEGTSWNLYCKYAQSVLPAAAAAVRHDDDDLLAAAAAMSNIHIYTGGSGLEQGWPCLTSRALLGSTESVSGLDLDPTGSSEVTLPRDLKSHQMKFKI